MDFSYSEEQEALREVARKIFVDLATHERIGEIEAGDEYFDRALWAELAKANLLGASLPEAVGGSGYGFFELCLLLQEQGRCVAPVPLYGTLLAADALARFGSAEQQQRWLPGVVSGDRVLAQAVQDDGGLDPSRPLAQARPDGAGWRLEGTKVLVSGAGLAERLLVTARTPDGTGAFLVDPAAPGVSLSRQLGTSREPVWWVALDGAGVAAADALPAADAAWIADRAVTGLCAIQLGVSERALEMTAEYGRTREQFDRPIGSFQAFHQRAGDAFMNLEVMRLVLWQAASRLSRGVDVEQSVDVAKFWACEAGQFVGYAAQHLHGGIGMDVDYPLHRYYMWAKQLELSLGSANRALARIGAAEAARAVTPG